MDRNQLIGLVLIAILFIGFFYVSKPSEEDLQRQKEIRDSIEQVQLQEKIKRAEQTVAAESMESEIIPQNTPDSVKINSLKHKVGSFANASIGENDFFTIENQLIKLKVSTKGGRPYSVELKDYKTHDSLPLRLFDGDSTVFGFTFHEQQGNKLFKIETHKLFFVSEEGISQVANESAKSLSMRLYVDADRYLEYKYTLEPNTYHVEFDVDFHNLQNVIAHNSTYLDLNWEVYAPGLEKGKSWESDNSTIYYKFKDDEADYLSERADEKIEQLTTKVEWIAYKQQFFSTVFIADKFFNSATVHATKIEDEDYLKTFSTNISLPYGREEDNNQGFRFYFGPNKYKVLKKYEIGLESLIPLGWGIFGWVNRFAVIPLFNFLGSFINSYGIIILIMTIIIKLVLFPLTYKSYLSSAKMRVLKPDIEEITKNIPKDKAMERQQKTMELYRKVGVNPMGGCLPVLLQMPILIAMFRFFPASIELRQQAFLWADDLSTYDAVLSWSANIPLLSSIYGNHISLFTLLMTISTFIYTYMNQSQMGDVNTSMPGMKTMQYIFPVMMLFWFNNYASGLSYYYFLANMITFLQMWLIKRFVDDEAIRKKLKEAKKKPAKKSNFMERIEKRNRELAKERAKKRR